MSNRLNSEIKLPLPNLPMVKNPELFQELSVIYVSIQMLQAELTAAKKRIADLEAYNTAHP